MKDKRTSNTLKITFHNPNSSDETARLLIKVIAENISESVLGCVEEAVDISYNILYNNIKTNAERSG